MTPTQKAAMKQALEALEGTRSSMRRDAPHLSGKVWGLADDAITALRAALAEPEPFQPDWVSYRQGVEDGKREVLANLAETAEPVGELEKLQLEAVAEGFESITEYVATLRTSASTYFTERNSARDVARKHRKTIEALESTQIRPVQYMIRARWPDGIEQYLDVRGVYQLSGLKVGIDVNMPDTHPFTAPQPPAPAEAVEPVHQFRKRGCADWFDGLPDHTDGGGPYEIRTLYTQPSAGDSEDLTIAYMAGYHAAEKAPAVEIDKLIEALDWCVAEINRDTPASRNARAAIAAHEAKK